MLNQELRLLAARTGGVFVDVAAALSDEHGELAAKFTRDGIHLNGSGYAAWARTLTEVARDRPAASRIQGLDGLRALSIALVLLAHLQGTRGLWAARLSGLDPAAVRIGLARGTGLLRHLGVSHHDADPRRAAPYGRPLPVTFYFRRTLRIFPPFYLDVAVIAGLLWRGVLTLREGDVLHAVTYTINYHRDRAWHLGHAWSLSVEEQFYLLWPALFRWLGPRRSVGLLAGYLRPPPYGGEWSPSCFRS